MNLRGQIKSDFEYFTSLTDEFASNVTYVKYDGSASVDLMAIFEQVSNKEQRFEGRSVFDNAVVFMNIPFEPTIYDSINDGVDTWSVTSFRPVDGGYKLEVSKDSINTHKHTKGRFR